ncbi:metallophosphoesterase [Paraferrimonas haliotis]|uniref:Calcineurin-like phosphoesterase domain-containing protein n=1 Tax=Paraferrimonas haliotis TaxID=2013866 RepID=A0AA37TUY3_9GAMM|nr:metallophosphoesterase [Paraferrimonas haliotis]GLS84691.1 hypothetical protein GCM10007894_26680 [Paraferrimonas haliotis]
MTLIHSKYIPIIFSRLKHYSLRGNGALWRELRKEFTESNQSYSAEQILAHIDNKVTNLIAQAKKPGGWTSESVYVEELNQGGMSGGVLDVNYWNSYMRPTIEIRARQLEQGLRFKTENKITDLFFIGDIHAQSGKLLALLDEQGFDLETQENAYHKIVFLGDLIDNHTASETDHLTLLNTVKRLVTDGKALCLLGNHEFNAIGWYLKNDKGEHYRDRNKASNLKQHQHFLQQIGEDSEQHKDWIEWFMSLPLYLNFGDVRAIHACWHDEDIDCLEKYLNPDHSLKVEHWPDAFNPNHELFRLIETLLKGPEIALPDGLTFKDKSGTTRTDMRIAWWNHRSRTYGDLAIGALQKNESIANIFINSENCKYKLPPVIPVMVGHYTLLPTDFPEPMSDSVVCLDYNAAKDDNPLVGYFMSDIDNWEESPAELINKENFAFIEQLSPNTMIVDGINDTLNIMVEKTPLFEGNEEFLETVSSILLKQWDPIGVYDQDNFDDAFEHEYHMYVEPVARLILAGDINQLTAYLFLTEQYLIGMEREEAEYDCAKVASCLMGI